MGISLRVFIVNEDDTLTRIPLSRYERLLKGDPEETAINEAIFGKNRC